MSEKLLEIYMNDFIQTGDLYFKNKKVDLDKPMGKKVRDLK
ncbi:MAG: hypothetical protein ACFFG0_03020 [Candidatus Thorarchaeota archaeon]